MIRHILSSPILVIGITKDHDSGCDLLARANMRGGDYSFSNFSKHWFWAYFFIRQIAMFAQLYVFAKFELGKSMVLFGAVSIVIANLLGVLLLKEVLRPAEYFGIVLAITAFVVIAYSK